MPADFLGCIKSVKKSLKKEHPKWSSKKIEDSAYAICTAWFKKKHGITPREWDKRHGRGSKENLVLAYDETVSRFVRVEPVKARIDVTEKYVRIRIKDPDLFSRFRIKWLDKKAGVKAVIGFYKKTKAPAGKNVKKKKSDIQALLFDREKFTTKEAKKWKREHFDKKRSKGSIRSVEVLIKKSKRNLIVSNNKVELVTAARIETPYSLAKAGFEKQLEALERNMAEAGVTSKIDKDLMFVSFVLTHVGVNANRDEFLEEEVKKAYNTAKYKLVNYQHSEPNIGCIFASKYVEGEKETPYVHVASAISQMKYPDIARDILVRNEQKRLFASMETWFESVKCSICGGEFTNSLDYCPHLLNRFSPSSTCSRQLLGITFAGAALAVDFPADNGAVITEIKRNSDLREEVR